MPRSVTAPTPRLLAFATLAFGHALLTWPPGRTLLLFGAGAAVAAGAELAVVRLGLLVHRARPRVAGVPVAVVVAWPASVYVAVRVAALVWTDPTTVAVAAATLATGADLLVDGDGVRAGWWTYPDHPLSVVRFRGAPWWNYVGWFVITGAVARLALAR